MSGKTNIEWADEVWNPIRGCTRVSEGCRNCYAENMAYRFSGPGMPFEGIVEKGPDDKPKWTGVIQVLPQEFDTPKSWRKPRVIFVCSMADLFHQAISDAVIKRLFETMIDTPRHDFLVLTKRPERMQSLLNHAEWWRDVPHENRDHIWLGTSIESQEEIRRLYHLRNTDATNRFLSIEPMLGKVELGKHIFGWYCVNCGFPNLGAIHCEACGNGTFCVDRGIDWVIVGGESGRKPRKLSLDWVRSLRDECAQHDIMFFFKQMMSGKQKVSLPLLDGRIHDNGPRR